MPRYTINDFRIGDKVHHLSNTKLAMVVIALNKELSEVTCRWLDKDGRMQVIDFMVAELGKASDLGPRIHGI